MNKVNFVACLAVVLLALAGATSAATLSCNAITTPAGAVSLAGIGQQTVSGTMVESGRNFDSTWTVNMCSSLVSTPPQGIAACENTNAGFLQQYSTSRCSASYDTMKADFAYDETYSGVKAEVADSVTLETAFIVVKCGTEDTLTVADATKKFAQVADGAFRSVLILQFSAKAACAAGAATPEPTPVPPVVGTPVPTPVPGPVGTPTPVANGALDVLIIMNFKWTSLTPQNANELAQRFVTKSLNADQRVPVVPRIVDSEDSVVRVVLKLMEALGGDAMNNIPDAVIIVDETDITVTVQNALRATPAAGKVPVISAFASGSDVFDPIARPYTMSIVPTDEQYIRSVFDLARDAFRWESIAVVYSMDTYGRDALNALNDFASQAANAKGPVIVSRTPMALTGNVADDAKVIENILKYKSTGVLCLLSDDMMPRLRAAQKQNPKAADLFFIINANGLSQLPLLVGTPSWGATIVPQFTRQAQWMLKGYDAVKFGDEVGAYLLSFAFDALGTVSDAVQIPGFSPRGTALFATMTTITYETGFTGRISFTTTGARSAASVIVLVASSVDIPLAAWTVNSTADKTPVIQSNQPLVATTVPKSPLTAVTVCMASAPSCPHVANMNHLLFMLLSANGNDTLLGDTSLIPIVFNTGYDGVEGLRNMLPVASTCNFLVGPGRSSVTFALTPLINQYQIPQIDFTSTSTAFSNKKRFPYFNRVVPDDTVSALATSVVVRHYGWDRVLVLTTDDEYGNSVSETTADAMINSGSVVEKIYRMPTLDKDVMRETLQKIKDKAISRIVLATFAGSATQTFDFFDVVTELEMENEYVFILGDGICQQALTRPEARAPLVGSICATPAYDKDRYFELQREYNNTEKLDTMREIITGAGFSPSCSLTYNDPYSAYAVDASLLLVASIVEAARVHTKDDVTKLNSTEIANSVAFTNASFLLQAIRSKEITGTTGTISLDSNGNRKFAMFLFNIQQPQGQVVEFASWNNVAHSIHGQHIVMLDLDKPLIWFDNSTDVPSSSHRSVTFIALQTAKEHPATIAASVIGFLLTIAMFVFCYRHYKLQKELEDQQRVGVGGEDMPDLGAQQPRRDINGATPAAVGTEMVSRESDTQKLDLFPQHNNNN